MPFLRRQSRHDTGTKQRIRNHFGFSLVELVAVLAISTLVAAAVAMNWTGSLAAASLTNSVETVVEADRQTRRHAITHSKNCNIEFNLRENEITVSRWRANKEYIRKIDLNPRTSLKAVSVRGGKLTIDRFGSGSTYYVQITGEYEKSKWLLFAGGSGQHFIFDNENDLQAFRQSLQSAGVDAD